MRWGSCIFGGFCGSLLAKLIKSYPMHTGNQHLEVDQRCLQGKHTIMIFQKLFCSVPVHWEYVSCWHNFHQIFHPPMADSKFHHSHEISSHKKRCSKWCHWKALFCCHLIENLHLPFLGIVFARHLSMDGLTPRSSDQPTKLAILRHRFGAEVVEGVKS